ncbi:hypothetical protein FOL47_010861, partial [Perkinsus chesapeaki]
MSCQLMEAVVAFQLLVILRNYTHMKSFDIYRKLPRDLTEATLTGATISVITIIVALYLFMSEVADYLTPHRTSRMLIEHNKDDYDTQLQINLDITFPRLPCDLLSFDAQDVMGSHAVEVSGHFFAERLTASGEVIGKDEVKASRSNGMLGQGLWSQGLFGGSGVAGESAERVRKMLEDKEGCRLVGFVKVNRVPGHLHLSSHSISYLLGGYAAYFNSAGFGHQKSEGVDKKRHEIDMSHTINHLSFGDEDEIISTLATWPQAKILAPLDGLTKEVSRNRLGNLDPEVLDVAGFHLRMKGKKKSGKGKKKKGVTSVALTIKQRILCHLFWAKFWARSLLDSISGDVDSSDEETKRVHINLGKRIDKALLKATAKVEEQAVVEFNVPGLWPFDGDMSWPRDYLRELGEVFLIRGQIPRHAGQSLKSLFLRKRRFPMVFFVYVCYVPSLGYLVSRCACVNCPTQVCLAYVASGRGDLSQTASSVAPSHMINIFSPSANGTDHNIHDKRIELANVAAVKSPEIKG